MYDDVTPGGAENPEQAPAYTRESLTEFAQRDFRGFLYLAEEAFPEKELECVTNSAGKDNVRFFNDAGELVVMDEEAFFTFIIDDLVEYLEDEQEIGVPQRLLMGIGLEDAGKGIIVDPGVASRAVRTQQIDDFTFDMKVKEHAYFKTGELPRELAGIIPAEMRLDHLTPQERRSAGMMNLLFEADMMYRALNDGAVTATNEQLGDEAQLACMPLSAEIRHTNADGMTTVIPLAYRDGALVPQVTEPIPATAQTCLGQAHALLRDNTKRQVAEIATAINYLKNNKTGLIGTLKAQALLQREKLLPRTVTLEDGTKVTTKLLSTSQSGEHTSLQLRSTVAGESVGEYSTNATLNSIDGLLKVTHFDPNAYDDELEFDDFEYDDEHEDENDIEAENVQDDAVLDADNEQEDVELEVNPQLVQLEKAFDKGRPHYTRLAEAARNVFMNQRIQRVADRVGDAKKLAVDLANEGMVILRAQEAGLPTHDTSLEREATQTR